MIFANKEFEKRIASQALVISNINSNIEKLSVAMMPYAGSSENKIVWDALFNKYYELKLQLAGEYRKLESLHTQNEAAFSNRSNRRQDLISSMFTPERLIPA